MQITDIIKKLVILEIKSRIDFDNNNERERKELRRWSEKVTKDMIELGKLIIDDNLLLNTDIGLEIFIIAVKTGHQKAIGELMLRMGEKLADKLNVYLYAYDALKSFISNL